MWFFGVFLAENDCLMYVAINGLQGVAKNCRLMNFSQANATIASAGLTCIKVIDACDI